MLDANELLEEYKEHYDCNDRKAIGMILEDMEDARKALLEMKLAILVKKGVIGG